MRASIIALTGFVALAATGIARAGLVNGGFESPALPAGTFVTIAPGGEPAGFAWTVSSGTVDLADGPNAFVQFPPFEGNQGLDLNGTDRGALFQDFATMPGQAYLLSFTYADNPVEAGVSTASVTVTDLATAGSLLSTSVSHSTSTNGPPPNADGQVFSDSFTAIGTTTRLAFASTSASNSESGGILLDAVRVDAVTPEPSSVVMLGIAGLRLLGFGSRHRRSARA